VFFYQSPYGGRVFFDSLGPPWPKHPCTDHPTERHRQFDPLPPAPKDAAVTSHGDWAPFFILRAEKLDGITKIDVVYRGVNMMLFLSFVPGFYFNIDDIVVFAQPWSDNTYQLDAYPSYAFGHRRVLAYVDKGLAIAAQKNHAQSWGLVGRGTVTNTINNRRFKYYWRCPKCEATVKGCGATRREASVARDEKKEQHKRVHPDYLALGRETARANRDGLLQDIRNGLDIGFYLDSRDDLRRYSTLFDASITRRSMRASKHAKGC
jgi:hypothetical protein